MAAAPSPVIAIVPGSGTGAGAVSSPDRPYKLKASCDPEIPEFVQGVFER